MSYQLIPSNNPNLFWIEPIQAHPPTQSYLPGDLGWLQVEQEWAPPKTTIKADGKVEWFVAAGVLLIGGIVAYKLAS